MSPSSSVRRIAQVGEGALDDSESDSEGSVPETSSGQARPQASALSTTLRGSPSGESLSPLRFPVYDRAAIRAGLPRGVSRYVELTPGV